MSHVFREGDLEFTFHEHWKVLKWDDDDAFKKGLRQVQHTAAVDFFCIRLDVPWFIEAKDFRSYRIENKERLSSGGLAAEVAHKIRDSLAGLVWACNRELDQGRLAPLLRSLLSHKSKIPIVLWLEEERPLAPAAASALGEAIKRELRWLNTSVTVMSRAFAEKNPLPGIVVTSLAHKRP